MLLDERSVPREIGSARSERIEFAIFMLMHRLRGKSGRKHRVVDCFRTVWSASHNDDIRGRWDFLTDGFGAELQSIRRMQFGY